MALEPVDSTTTDASTFKGNDIDSNGDGVVDEADHAATAVDADTLDGNDSSAFADAGHSHSHGDLSNVGADDHHSRYADDEARSAVDGSALAALEATTRLTIPVFDSTGNVPAQPEGSIVFVRGDGLYVENGQ